MSKVPDSQQRMRHYSATRSLITTIILITVVPSISLVSVNFILTHHLYPYLSLEAKAKTITGSDQKDLNTSSHQPLEARHSSTTLDPRQILWSQEDTALLNTPGGDLPIAHIGQNFALKPIGDTASVNGKLWYHVQWSTPEEANSGWVSATAVTFTSPGKVPGNADFDVLSPDLAAYLGSLGSNAGAVVYDMTRQRYYTYNSNGQFITASSIKVPIMLTFLDMLESQGRQIDDQQMDLLTTMIENSNNDSASELYYNEIGGATGITNFMQKVGISGLQPDATAWGYSLITPQAMVDLLTDLYQGKILTAQDRTLALNLMENVESDQQVGVGDTAPSQATVAMKDGWVTGPDNLWAMNTSGIVITGKETYIISVYTQEQPTLGDGQATVRKVCSAVATDLA
jgi:beta-lactamase class A